MARQPSDFRWKEYDHSTDLPDDDAGTWKGCQVASEDKRLRIEPSRNSYARRVAVFH